MKAICLLFLLSSCLYRMPGEGEFRAVPLTNNPQITKDPGKLSIPGMK